MKYVVCVPDGASDEPVAELGGDTPLEAAAMPALASLASRGEVGRAATIPPGFPPGSDVGNMSILGYDPARYHTGRAPIEAAALGIPLADADCTPPHDLTDHPAVWPTGPAAPKLQRLMDASREVVPGFGLAANQVWLWGQGTRPRLPSFEDAHGLDAGLVSAVDLVRGLGALTGMAIADVEGITGWYDTNYEGKRDAALVALRDGADLFLIHVEA